MKETAAGSGVDRLELGRGLLWLGTSNVLAKVLDAFSALVVLRFLSRESLGLATLAWAATALAETFNAFGIGAALIQSPQLSEATKAGAAWYAIGTSLLLTLALCAAAPALAAFYGLPALVSLMQVSSVKLLLVGCANVPLALASRSLRYERLSAIATLSTVLASATTIVLAALGAGAWAPLIGNTAHGAFQLLWVLVLAPMPLRMTFSWPELRPLARTGWALASAGAAGQVSRNLDYWILGRIGGAAALGSYRVAFELAMLPMFTALQVANRSSLPVYSRLAADPGRLGAAVSWTARAASIVLLAPLLLVFLEGDALFWAIGKTSDPSLQLATRVLCLAAFLRALAQFALPALIATGHSRLVLLEAVVTAVALAASFGACVLVLDETDPREQIALGWLLACSLLVPFQLALLRRLDTRVGPQLLRSLKAPLLSALGVGGLCWALQQASPLGPGLPRLAVHGGVIVLSYAAATRCVLGVRLEDMWRFSSSLEKRRSSTLRDESRSA